MRARSLLPVLFAAAAAAAAACAPAPGVGEVRALGAVRHDRVPQALPEAWLAGWEADARALPAAPIGSSEALALVRDCALRQAWLDPEALRVEPALPDGIRVVWRPRVPALAVVRRGEPVAVIASDGTVLPPGLEGALLDALLTVPWSAEMVLEPGRRVASPLLQEALAARLEAKWVRDEAGLPVVGMRRQAGVPADPDGVPPPLDFVLADGRSLAWGWSAATEERIRPPREVRVPPEEKARRLAVVLRAYPGLVGLSRVVLDRPRVHVYDVAGREVAPPNGDWMR